MNSESGLAAAAEQLNATIGETRREQISSIAPVWARRFAVASGEVDPVYFDDEAARAAGFAGTPLPPLLLSSTRSWGPGPGRDDLGEDGMSLVEIGYPRGHGLRALGGGQALTFHADALAGVELVAEAEVTGTQIKNGRSGDLLIVEIERRFLGVDGELLITCNESRILR